MKEEILIAGFGGQGIVMCGSLLCYGGMLEGREVTGIPSYGPEMRGGTANFSVVISDSEITSPIITNPSVFIAMNQPSLDKFESQVKSGGLILVNSTLIDRELRRGDVSAVEIPATKKASELGNLKCANIIMLGRLIRETGLLSPQSVLNSLKEVLPKRAYDLLSLNKRAFEIGLEAV